MEPFEGELIAGLLIPQMVDREIQGSISGLNESTATSRLCDKSIFCACLTGPFPTAQMSANCATIGGMATIRDKLGHHCFQAGHHSVSRESAPVPQGRLGSHPVPRRRVRSWSAIAN